MDEPTAAISVRQVAEVLALIKRLKDTGHAVILVSHRMPDVFDVCDRVAVLRRGKKVADKRIKADKSRRSHGPDHGGDRSSMTDAKIDAKTQHTDRPCPASRTSPALKSNRPCRS